jgi:hypothetical protein
VAGPETLISDTFPPPLISFLIITSCPPRLQKPIFVS